MRIVPIEESIGVEVTGAQMAHLSDADLETLKQAVFARGVAVLREQELSPEQHIAFAHRWSGIDINNYFPLNGEYPEIAEVRKEADQVTNIGGGWHTDHSYDAVPAMGSVLVARTLPPSGGDTMFAHMGSAYEALDEDTQAEIEGLRAYHSADHIYAPDGAYARTDQGKALRGQEMTTGATHPVVVRHPQTGAKLLYVNPAFTLHFEGMTRADSMPLLQQLYAEAMNPDHHCRVQWEEGTVTIWDNRTTWHMAANDYQGHARIMHRITLTGEALAA